MLIGALKAALDQDVIKKIHLQVFNKKRQKKKTDLFIVSWGKNKNISRYS